MPREIEKDDGWDLPEPKDINEIGVRDKRVIVQEGLGPKQDIVVIGPTPDDMEPDDLPVIYLKMGGEIVDGKVVRGVEKRILSTSRGDGFIDGFHASGSAQVSIYLSASTGFGADPVRIQRDNVRIMVGADGPNKIFYVDGVEGNEKAEQAATVLTDLGVKKERILFDTGKFRRQAGGGML